MKLKSYIMEKSENQPKVKQKKYQSKSKGYSEEGDSFLYNSHQDERELAEVTNFKYTQDSSDNTY